MIPGGIFGRIPEKKPSKMSSGAFGKTAAGTPGRIVREMYEWMSLRNSGAFFKLILGEFPEKILWCLAKKIFKESLEELLEELFKGLFEVISLRIKESLMIFKEMFKYEFFKSPISIAEQFLKKVQKIL